MADIFFILLIAAAAYKLKVVRPITDINENYVSVENCRMLKGLFALVIVFVHIASKPTSGILFPIFGYIGYLAVSVFLFISGYGLIKKYSADEHYLDSFIKSKTFAILIPYTIIIIIYWAASFLTSSPYSFSDVIMSLYNGTPIADNSWYIITCLIYYLVFFLLCKFFKHNVKAVVISVVVFCFIWVALCRIAHYWQWWYLSTFAFAIGMFWSLFEEKIIRICKTNYLAYAIPLILLFFLSAFSTFCFESYVFKIVCSAIFAILVFVICMKVELKSPILRYYGGLSLELYLIHGLFIRIFRSELLYINNEFLYILSIIAFSTASAALLNIVFSKIKSVVRK